MQKTGMEAQERSLPGDEERLKQEQFHKLIVPGDRDFDSGEVVLRFPDMIEGRVPVVRLRLVNYPKSEAVHSGDFACVTVRTTGADIDSHLYPLVVVDAICIDGLSAQDFKGDGLPPDATASRLLIQEANAEHFPTGIVKLGDLYDFETFGASTRPPYFSRKKEYDLSTNFRIETNRGPAFDVKSYLRQKYMGWMVESLKQNTQVSEQTPVHWYAGVYGIFHIVCDPQSKLVHYLELLRFNTLYLSHQFLDC